MKNYFFILFFILSIPLYSQNIDGLWVNSYLRNAILNDSLVNYNENYIPMMISIKDNKIALFQQMEPSTVSYIRLKKNAKNHYENKLGKFYLEDSVLVYNNSKKVIRFTAGNITGDNFKVNSKLTQNYINYSEFKIFINLETKESGQLKCIAGNDAVYCTTNLTTFTYTIFVSNPYYFKGKFNKLKYYMKINWGKFTKNYLIEKERNQINLIDIDSNKAIYVLK